MTGYMCHSCRLVYYSTTEVAEWEIVFPPGSPLHYEAVVECIYCRGLSFSEELQ
jgi:hypothetical protein